MKKGDLMGWPEPTVDEPTVETLMEWSDEERCQATDGCWLEKDMRLCEHGHPSWAVVLGLVPDPSGD
jgi:hypothetical protein